ncbi:helix-turn-helix domain-containing protein [Aeromicrobium sp. UC242_57]|uniref:helix-turn-helix domain-containing protein n=1 Tax=Aeromicrobium sp. UC242_57 TaxID=3374624 RepID=UPI00379CA2B2
MGLESPDPAAQVLGRGCGGFRQWRTACRLVAATDYLTTGRDVRWVSDRVGFESASGFCRAFRAEFGMPPSAYATLVRTPGANERQRTAQRDAEVVRLLRQQWTGQPGPRSIPASATPPLVNNFHVIIWMYRGCARVQVGERSWKLGTGQAIWLPAGIPNRVEVDADSIMMPIQSAPASTRLSEQDVQVFNVPEQDEEAMLRGAVAQYTCLRPPGYDELRGWYAFEDGVVGAVARVSSGTAEQSFTAAMDSARRLLLGGMAPGSVAERLGYSHASSFSRAFTRSDGVSPRLFQQQGSFRSPAGPAPDA